MYCTIILGLYDVFVCVIFVLETVIVTLLSSHVVNQDVNLRRRVRLKVPKTQEVLSGCGGMAFATPEEFVFRVPE